MGSVGWAKDEGGQEKGSTSHSPSSWRWWCHTNTWVQIYVKIFAQKCKNENTFVIFFHPQVIVVLGRLQELLTMVKLPKQVNSGSWNFSYELTRRWFLISFWKAELSAEMEKTESDLKTELATDFVRCGRYISYFSVGTFPIHFPINCSGYISYFLLDTFPCFCWIHFLFFQ